MPMSKPLTKHFSKEFGKKERVLNYTTQTYQLSRPNKVGSVMALIRECQPKSFEEWETWYFGNAWTDGKTPNKITKESLEELGERLYVKIKEIVIPEWTEAFNQCFFDEGRLIILTNAFQKKTQKTLKQEIEKGSAEFRLGVLLHEARLEKGMTQGQLAEKCRTNKAYISKVENNIKDVRLSTPRKIVEVGLGGQLQLSIRV